MEEGSAISYKENADETAGALKAKYRKKPACQNKPGKVLPPG